MKIIQVVSSIWNESAGPSHSVPGLSRGLSISGADVILHTLDRSPLHDTPYTISIHPRRSFPTRALARSPQMLSDMRKDCTCAQIIHANGCWQLPCIYANRACKGTNCKFVISPRGMVSPVALARSRWKKALVGMMGQWRAFREADMFHAASIKEMEEIRLLGCKQPVVVLPNGLDIPIVNASKNASHHKLVFFGRVHKTKGVDKLLTAWSVIHAKLPDWSLDIIGPDCGIMDELTYYVANTKLPRVTFVGELKGQSKYVALAAADLYVFPSLTENFGITVAEALSCGTPVIASKGCPWSGLVDHNCGWWIDNDIDTIAKTILEAASNSTLLSQMGENGKKWITQDFSWQSIGKKMLCAYNWLINGGEKYDFIYV